MTPVQHVTLGDYTFRFEWKPSTLDNRDQWFIEHVEGADVEMRWLMSEVNEHFEWDNPNLPAILREDIAEHEVEHGVWKTKGY